MKITTKAVEHTDSKPKMSLLPVSFYINIHIHEYFPRPICQELYQVCLYILFHVIPTTNLSRLYSHCNLTEDWILILSFDSYMYVPIDVSSGFVLLCFVLFSLSLCTIQFQAHISSGF